jgi:hypothetical protein
VTKSPTSAKLAKNHSVFPNRDVLRGSDHFTAIV